MKMNKVFALFKKDFLDGLKNYQIIIIVATPILLSVLFSTLYKDSKNKTMIPRIGLVGAFQHPLFNRLASESYGVKVRFCQDLDELEKRIIEGEIGFGVILPHSIDFQVKNGNQSEIKIIYPDGVSEFTVERIYSTFEKEIRRYYNIPEPPMPIKITMQPVGGDKKEDRAFSNDLFPMLVLMAMGMVGFIGMPISYVEEKEKKTLDAIFLTPTTSNEIILGKNLFGFFLILLTVAAMILLSHKFQGNQYYFWLFVVLGAFFCLLCGLIIANIAKNQASVNAFGTTLFMIFQLVPNLSQSSELMRSISPIVPSTHIGRGLKKSLFLDLAKVDISQDLVWTIFFVLLAYLILFIMVKRQTH
ncbi:MAG: ABC transporter permease [Candidatus Riflebacteria bacterium]|nr:ABC transporter permease [Candidatus Riflebacteria bacterium]